MASILASFSTEAATALPFYTLQDFEAFGQSMRHISGATLFAYTPYLPNEAFREEWETHAQENQAWFAQSHTLMDNKQTVKYPEQMKVPLRIWRETNITATRIIDNTGPPYAPLWLLSPPPPDTSRLNLNLYRRGDFVDQLEFVRKKEYDALSAPRPVDQWLGSALPRNEEDDSPLSVLMHPIESSLEAPQAFFAAVVSAVIPFSVYFTNVGTCFVSDTNVTWN